MDVQSTHRPRAANKSTLVDLATSNETAVILPINPRMDSAKSTCGDFVIHQDMA